MNIKKKIIDLEVSNNIIGVESNQNQKLLQQKSRESETDQEGKPQTDSPDFSYTNYDRRKKGKIEK